MLLCQPNWGQEPRDLEILKSNNKWSPLKGESRVKVSGILHCRMGGVCPSPLHFSRGSPSTLPFPTVSRLSQFTSELILPRSPQPFCSHLSAEERLCSAPSSGLRLTLTQILTLLRTCCVTSSKLLDPSKPQFPHH